MMGLSHGDSNQSYNDIDYALYLYHQGGALYVYEGGVNKGQVGTYAAGDRLRVSVEGGVVKYRKNGTLLYTSAASPQYPLSADTSLYHPNATITDATIAATATTDVRWIVSDHLGTPRMVFDQTGSLAGVRRHDYLPFGEELAAGVSGRAADQGYGQPDVLRQHFTSKERDDETGMDYFFARYYSSAQGRFTSPDEFQGGPRELATLGGGHPDKQALPYAEIAAPQSLNKYQYCLNNPLRYIDPDGHQEVEGQQAQEPGFFERIVKSFQQVLGSLAGTLQRAAEPEKAPEEIRGPGPLGNTDRAIQAYMDEAGRRLELATDVVMYADITGAGGVTVGVLKGDPAQAITSGAGGVFGVIVPGGKHAAKPVTDAIAKLGLKIVGNKGGIITVSGGASDAGKLFNLLRGNNPVSKRTGAMGGDIFSATSATGSNTTVTFRAASQSQSKMLTVDVSGIQGRVRKVKIKP